MAGGSKGDRCIGVGLRAGVPLWRASRRVQRTGPSPLRTGGRFPKRPYGTAGRKSSLGRAAAAWARRRRSAAGAPGRAASWVVVSLEVSGNSRMLKGRTCDIMSIDTARSPGSRHYAENAGRMKIVGAASGILFIVIDSVCWCRDLLKRLKLGDRTNLI